MITLCGAGRIYYDLNGINHPPGIAIRPASYLRPCLGTDRHGLVHLLMAPAHRALNQCLELISLQGLEYINARPGKERPIHLERPVFCGRTDKCEKPAFHMRQKSI